MRKGPILAALGLIAAGAAGQTNEPVGVLLSAARDGRILRSSLPAGLPARPGEILFAGDRLRAGKEPASYLYCPSRSSQVLEAQGEALFDAKAVKVEKGKLASQTEVAACFLPPIQLAAASRQHAGGMVMREVPPPLRLVSPLGEPVLDAAPRFLWKSVPKADAYEIEVANSAGDVIWKTRLKQTQTQYPGHAPPLVAPSTYSWKVTALTQEKPLAATSSQFQVLRLAERRLIRQELEDIQKALDQQPSNPGLRLVKAARLERVGLMSQALDEYQAVAPAWTETNWLPVKLTELTAAVQKAQRDALPKP